MARQSSRLALLPSTQDAAGTLTARVSYAPIDVSTLATQFWSAQSSVEYGAAAPYALLMVLISIPATVVLARQTRDTRTTPRRKPRATMDAT